MQECVWIHKKRFILETDLLFLLVGITIHQQPVIISIGPLTKHGGD